MATSKRLDVSNSLPDDGDVIMKSTPCAAPSHDPSNPSRKLYPPKEHSNWKLIKKHFLAVRFLANIAPKRDKYHLDFHRYAHTGNNPNSSSIININRKNMASRDVCITGSTPCLQTIKKTED